MNKSAILGTLAVLAVAIVLVAVSLHPDDDRRVDTDGMYRGYDALYDYTVSGSTADTYASHLERVVSEEATLFVQSALEGYPLRTIGPCAFSACSSSTIVIPSTVSSVDPLAFDGCQAGAVVFLGDIPEGVDGTDGRMTTLDTYGGTAETVIVEEGSGRLTFLLCDGAAVLIGATGSGVLEVPDHVASNDGVSHPVTAVGSGSFRSSSFESVGIPETVVRIMDRAFYGCEGLISVNLPTTLESVEDEAFRYCVCLTDVNLVRVGFIGFEAFRDCRSLTSVIVPDTVTFMGDGAFYICSSVRTVSIGSGLGYIPDRAFGYCSSLEEIIFHGEIFSVGDYAFAMCSVLGSAELTNTVTIGDSAFRECRMLTSLSMRALESLGANALYNCRSLAELEFPSTLREMGDGALNNCRSLEDVWFYGPMPDMDAEMLVELGCVVHVAEGYSDAWGSFPGEMVTFR